MLFVDCRGLSCPEPVIKTRRVLEVNPEASVTALVDGATPRDNLLLMAEKLGRPVSWEEEAPAGYRVIIGPANQPAEVKRETPGSPLEPATKSGESSTGELKPGPLVVVLASDRLGEGDETLGALLMRSFLTSLREVEVPATLICLNRGIYLSTEGSPVLEQLRAFEAQGVEVLSCGTCLDFYNRKDALRVGKVSNMFTIAERMAAAGRLIRW